MPDARRRALRSWTAALAAVAVTGLLAACAARAPASGPAGMTLPRGRAVWLLTRYALGALVADPAVRAGLAGSRIYEILQPGQQPLPGVAATPVVTFPAVAPLRETLATGRLPAGTGAVLYDPEAWSFTPADEQRDPARAAATAAGLARAHGLQIIVAPALNLAAVLAPGSAPRWRRFLDLRLAAELARVADVIDLQAQSLERSPGTYGAFVREAAGQARAAKPGVTVVAGLSTNPPGAVVGSQQILAAIRATWPAVDGYWLNIPGRGPRCPTCGPAAPDVGIAALRAVF
jgi:hypothetical protein